LGSIVQRAATSHGPGVVGQQVENLNRWYVQQTQVSPVELLSRARQSHVINVQQYHAIRRDPAASAEFAETYKQGLNNFELDGSGSLTQNGLIQAANLKDVLQRHSGPRVKMGTNRNQPELGST
jgi:hypothetical protein